MSLLQAVNQTRTYAAIAAPGSEWWAVRCRGCGQWVTKFDFSREQALRIAEGHECGGAA